MKRGAADTGSEAGFTLVETLIAFLILAISLTIIVQSIGQATTQIRKSDEVDFIRQLGERTMLAARADETRGAANGTDKDSGLAWKWSRLPFLRQDRGGALEPVVLVTVEIARPSQETPALVLKSIQLAKPKP